MNIVTPGVGYLLIGLFGLMLILVTWFASRSPRWTKTQAGFLVAGRDVPWWLAAPSIGASWIWAPALFVSVQKAYELGLPGAFWFTVPNIFALIVFAFLAPRLRDKIPGGYTLPDWIRHRFGEERLHRIYLVPYIWYQVMAITVQIFVGGLLLNYITGIPLNILMFIMLAVGLAYTLISGLRASIITDFLQIAFILVGIFIIVPWVISVAGLDSIARGLGGVARNRNIFDLGVAFSFGVVTSIGLIAGSISDQQYWQRSFAIRRDHLVRAFVGGGILFGIVPIAMSVLGFIGADPAMGITPPEGTGLPLIGVATVVKLLPALGAFLFVIVLLAGLESTLDSALCAASSLYAIDMAPLTDAERNLLRKERLLLPLTDEEKQVKERLDALSVRRSRIAMFGLSALGLITALIVQHLFSLDRLWWIFNGVASCFAVPTVLSIYWDRLSSKGAFWGIVASLVGLVPFVYGNWVQNDVITVLSAVAIIVVNLAFCLAFKRETPWREEPKGALAEPV